MDNLVRPFGRGMLSPSENISTILLYGGGKTEKVEPENTEQTKDFLNNLDTFIDQIASVGESVDDMSGVAKLSDGAFNGLDGTNDYYAVFNNFSIIAFTEGRSEIVKIHQNFGAHWNAFFFGEAPRVVSFNGHFIDTPDYPYYQEFMTAYDRYLCGRKAIENKMKMKMVFDGKLIGGYIIGVSLNASADMPRLKTFNFQVVVNSDQFVRRNVIFKNNANGTVVSVAVDNGMTNVARINSWMKNNMKPGTYKKTETNTSPGGVAETYTSLGGVNDIADGGSVIVTDISIPPVQQI